MRLLPVVLWGGMITWLSLMPSPPHVAGILGWDKLQHAGAYGLLSLLTARALLALPGRPAAHAWRYAIAAAVAYGGFIEILQWLMQAGRTAEWWDLLADALGAVICCALFRHIAIIRSRRTTQPG